MATTTFEVKGSSVGLTSILQAGKHSVVIDESERMGGKDQGANPLQYVLSALAGCENVVAQMVAKQMNFDLEGIDFEIAGSFDTKGLMGNPDVRPYFNEVTLKAKVKTTEADERIQELKRHVDARCPVFTMLEAADIEMNTVWTRA